MLHSQWFVYIENSVQCVWKLGPHSWVANDTELFLHYFHHTLKDHHQFKSGRYDRSVSEVKVRRTLKAIAWVWFTWRRFSVVPVVVRQAPTPYHQGRHHRRELAETVGRVNCWLPLRRLRPRPALGVVVGWRVDSRRAWPPACLGIARPAAGTVEACTVSLSGVTCTVNS